MPTPSPLIISKSDFETLAALVKHAKSESAELLEDEISRASIVPPQEVPDNVVTMNSTVRFVDEDTGKESTVTLVYPQDASIEESKISILAPVGIALIGLRVGQSIEWPLPTGKSKKLKVVAVTPPSMSA